jgi:hypothetical protein
MTDLIPEGRPIFHGNFPDVAQPCAFIWMGQRYEVKPPEPTMRELLTQLYTDLFANPEAVQECGFDLGTTAEQAAAADIGDAQKRGFRHIRSLVEAVLEVEGSDRSGAASRIMDRLMLVDLL